MTTAMELTPVKRDFAKTSTPLLSSCDSGYFGSSAESRYKVPYFSLSPLKESPSKKVYNDLSSLTNFSNYIEDSRYDKEAKQSVIKQLRFDDSGWENDSLSAKQSTHITKYPLYPWALLSRKVKKNVSNQNWKKAKVDILKMLKLRNLDCVISDLLSHLPAVDLVRMRAVSKIWKYIVTKDARANKRRKEYLQRIKSIKENKESTESSDSHQRYEHRLIFNDIANSTNNFAPPAPKSYNTKFESFLKEAKTIQAGVLAKCPRCSFAAKPHNDVYKCSECDYIFCNRNFLFTNTLDSPMLPVPNLIIGSKRCKKNLRRL